MDAINPVRKELDIALGDVLERHRAQSADRFGPVYGFGGDAIVGLVFFLVELFAWLARESTGPTAKGRLAAIEQTDSGIDLIDTSGQRESVPREALRLQVASIWQPRRLLILTTWIKGPARLRRTVALGTVAWVPIQTESTVLEWENLLGVKVQPQVTQQVSM